MKAVLVIDMPNRCIECPCGCYMRDGTVACGVIDLGTTEESPRPEWCPLKPMPKKEEHKKGLCSDFILGYEEGWNDCLEEIENG